MTCDVRKGNRRVGLAYIREVKSGLQYPRTMMYGFFAKRTDPPSSSLLFWLPPSSFLPSPATFPDPLWPPIARSRDFLRYYLAVRLLTELHSPLRFCL